MDCPLLAAWAGIGPGIEPREDLGLSPHPPRHVFITSKRRDLAPCPPNSSHRPPVGELPLLRMVTEGAQGGGDPCTYPQLLILSMVLFLF